MYVILLSGFVAGLSLIMAIGAQNLFVIRNGIQNRYVFTTALVCSLCDMLLVALGAYGMRAYLDQFTWLQTALQWGGVAFLLWYGLTSIKSGLSHKNQTFRSTDQVTVSSRHKAIGTALVLSLLNPHALLDTVVILGGMIHDQLENDRSLFAGGVILASFSWFFTLSYLARKFGSRINSPRIWKGLEIVSGCIMLGFAYKLAH